MNHIFADRLTKVTFSNNNLRITLVQEGPDNSEIEAGTLIIPVSQASNFVNGLADGLKQLDEQMKAQRAKTQGGTQ